MLETHFFAFRLGATSNTTLQILSRKGREGTLKELVCFKRLAELRSRPQVGVLPDIRMGSKVDQNPLATLNWILMRKKFTP